MGTDSKVSMKSVANRCGEDVMEKILIVGPSSTKSKGGMSTVIGLSLIHI